MEPIIKPIPLETVRLAARGMAREAAKITAAVEFAKKSGVAESMEALIARLARL